MELKELEKSLDTALADFMDWTNAKEIELQTSTDNDVYSAFHDMRDATQGLFNDFKNEIIKYLSENQS
ncbi:MAG: hypothetical protein IJ740_07805 [Ruminococcus sp.]|nr:hypothetical protein [Ruminococcus sp.]